MNLLNRYIIIEIVKYFMAALAVVLCIFVAIDYLGTMDEFISADLSLWRAFQYVLYKAPFITTQAMPIMLLMAILITFGLMSRNNELIIINASGISIYTLVRPVLWISAFAGLSLFFLSEHVVPLTIQKSYAIKHHEIRKASNISVKKKNIWKKGYRTITHIKYFNPTSGTINGFTRYFFDTDFRMIRRIDAREGQYKDKHWILLNCMDQQLDRKTDSYHVSLTAQLTENLQLHPDDISRVIKKSEEMNFSELWDYINGVEAEGYDATAYRVDLHAKGANPFVCIIMGMVGIGLTAKRRLNKGLPISITLGIGIGFGYWVFQSFCLSLGYGGVLPAWIAAWAASFIFLCAGVVLILNAE